MSRPLILASQSPQRRQLLKALHVPFKIVPSKVSERSSQTNPRLLVKELSIRKANAVARKRRAGLILGADTIVLCRGKILLKPRSKKDSFKMLSTLNGRWQRVYTGVALIDAETGRCWSEVTLSRVKARKLDQAGLNRLAGKHMDKAGSYAMQDHQDPFIEKVVGPKDNVIGLPLDSVRRLIRKSATAISRYKLARRKQ